MMPKELEQVVLSRIGYSVKWDIEEAKLLNNGNPLIITINQDIDKAILHIGKEVYGKRYLDYQKIEFEVPKNWFQHLKKALKLEYEKSIIIKKVIFDVRALFPSLQGTNPILVVDKKDLGYEFIR